MSFAALVASAIPDSNGFFSFVREGYFSVVADKIAGMAGSDFWNILAEGVPEDVQPENWAALSSFLWSSRKRARKNKEKADRYRSAIYALHRFGLISIDRLIAVAVDAIVDFPEDAAIFLAVIKVGDGMRIIQPLKEELSLRGICQGDKLSLSRGVVQALRPWLYDAIYSSDASVVREAVFVCLTVEGRWGDGGKGLARHANGALFADGAPTMQKRRWWRRLFPRL